MKVKINTIKIDQQDHELYFFKIKASQLYDLVEINQRDSDKDAGYQRALSPSRAKSISRYIIDKKRPIAPAIIIALNHAEFNPQTNQLEIHKRPDAGWVIDGQHRLKGAKIASEDSVDIELPVISYLNVSLKYQIEQFITINQEAKSVPSTLYLDLLKQLPGENKSPVLLAKEKTVSIANELRKNDDDDNIFYERISPVTPLKKGQVSLTNFVRKVHPLLVEGKGNFSTYSMQQFQKILTNYFTGLSKYQPDFFVSFENNPFFKTLGFGALLNALPIFFQWVTKENHGKFTIETVEEGFRKLDSTDFDFNNWKKMGSGSDAEKRAGLDLITAIEDAFSQNGSESITLD
jgi:DGQHR domain-containing protein